MDHERVGIGLSGMSCGIMELSRMTSDSEGVVYAVLSRLYHPSRGNPAAFVMWSDLVEKTELCDYIRSLCLGEVFPSPIADNPHTGNVIRVWTWVVNHEKAKTFYAQKRIQKLGTVGT